MNKRNKGRGGYLSEMARLQEELRATPTRTWKPNPTQQAKDYQYIGKRTQLAQDRVAFAKRLVEDNPNMDMDEALDIARKELPDIGVEIGVHDG